MRYLRRTLILSLLIGSATFLPAQEPNPTGAQRMDLAGRIKAVSTTASRTDVPWQQPAGPSLIVPTSVGNVNSTPRETRPGQRGGSMAAFSAKLFSLSFMGRGI